MSWVSTVSSCGGRELMQVSDWGGGAWSFRELPQFLQALQLLGVTASLISPSTALCLVADILVPGGRKPNSHWPKKSPSLSPEGVLLWLANMSFHCSRAELGIPIKPRVRERGSPNNRAVPGRRWRGVHRSGQPPPTTVAKGESQVSPSPWTQRFSSYWEPR